MLFIVTVFLMHFTWKYCIKSTCLLFFSKSTLPFLRFSKIDFTFFSGLRPKKVKDFTFFSKKNKHCTLTTKNCWILPFARSVSISISLRHHWHKLSWEFAAIEYEGASWETSAEEEVAEKKKDPKKCEGCNKTSDNPILWRNRPVFQPAIQIIDSSRELRAR